MKTLLILLLLCLPAQAQIGNTSSLYGPTVPMSTVASLPTCNASLLGTVVGVTNALLPSVLATVVGGGLVTVLVYCDGSNWKVL